MVWFTWDVPAMVKALAPLAQDLVRVIAPSADEKAKTLEVDQKTKTQRVKEAFKSFAADVSKSSLERRLQDDRDREALKRGSERP